MKHTLSAFVFFYICFAETAHANVEREKIPKPKLGLEIAEVGKKYLLRGEDGVKISVSLLSEYLKKEPHKLLVVNSRVVKEIRERDLENGGIFVISGNRGYDYLAFLIDFGGPGTCVWDQHLEIYPITDFADDLLSKRGEVKPTKAIQTGGYLDCKDVPDGKACGCGSWQAALRVKKGPLYMELEVEPKITFLEPNEKPLLPPKETVEF